MDQPVLQRDLRASQTCGMLQETGACNNSLGLVLVVSEAKVSG